MQALIAVVAALVGIGLGFWLRGLTARAEKAAAANERAQLAQRNAELAADVAGVRAEIAGLREVAEKRAGFESLCAERQGIIDRMTAELGAVRADLQAKSDSEREMSKRNGELETELRNKEQNLQEKEAFLETAKKALGDHFQILASEVLDTKAKSFAEASQKDLGNLLTPLQTQLKEFRERVDKVQTDSTAGVTELRTLIGTLNTMNQKLSEEAHNLATALRRDTKAQGNWGETILRNILEKSGLQEGIHFTFQENFAELDDAGNPKQRRQTDVIVKLPNGRHVIIDSKVSLNSYNDSVNANDEKARTDCLKKHVSSIRAHFSDLASRNYQKLSGIQTPDFVVMFVPIEPAFLLALQNDDQIWADAYARGVLLCGPTTVLFVVRIVADLWRQEKQVRNVKDVMRRGELLYDKFVGFIADMERIGRNIQSTREAYSDAMDKLSKADGNLIGQVEKLKRLGVSSNKSIPKKLLEEAGVDEPLALAANAEEPVPAE